MPGEWCESRNGKASVSSPRMGSQEGCALVSGLCHRPLPTAPVVEDLLSDAFRRMLDRRTGFPREFGTETGVLDLDPVDHEAPGKLCEGSGESQRLTEAETVGTGRAAGR